MQGIQIPLHVLSLIIESMIMLPPFLKQNKIKKYFLVYEFEPFEFLFKKLSGLSCNPFRLNFKIRVY